jgi:hypothetical protein
MRLENVHPFLNLYNNFWFAWSMASLVLCQKLAESDGTVMPSVTWMDWFVFSLHDINLHTIFQEHNPGVKRYLPIQEDLLSIWISVQVRLKTLKMLHYFCCLQAFILTILSKNKYSRIVYTHYFISSVISCLTHEGEVIPVHALKSGGVSRGVAPLIINLSARWRW